MTFRLNQGLDLEVQTVAVRDTLNNDIEHNVRGETGPKCYITNGLTGKKTKFTLINVY